MHLPRRILRIFTSALLLAVCSPAEHYRFRHFGPEEGLGTAVTALWQDRTGFLWIGTSNGLFRYDGARFQRYGMEDGLPSVQIRNLHESADGTLWVITGRGLARLRHRRFELIPVAALNGSADLAAVASTGGKLYVGHSNGLLAGQVGFSDAYPHLERVAGVPAQPVNFVAADEAGVWFGCGLRLCRMDDSGVRILGEAEGLPAERWAAMARDEHGTLWLRGPQHLYVLPAGARRFIARDKGLPQSSNTVMSVITTPAGALVSTDLGLARWTDNRWEIIGSGQGLETDTTTALLRDREGSIWIGLWGAGLSRWGGQAEWTNFTMADGLSNNIVWAIQRDAKGSLWVGTDRGLVEMRDGGVVRTLTKIAGLGGDKIKALVKSPDGALWVASLPGGISRIDPETRQIRVYGAASGLDDDRIVGLHLDRDNRLWASSTEGLYRSTGLDRNLRFERQELPGAHARTAFFRFLDDRRGRIWVTSNAGLFRLENRHWSRFGVKDGLRADATSHITEDADGAIWVSYREPVGFSRLVETGEGFQIQDFSKKDGMPSDYILFFGLDAARRLWVGTDNGVAVRANQAWTVFTHEDGLVWDDCAANGFLAEPDGSVWVGTLRGLSRYTPSGHAIPSIAPPVAVTAIEFGEHKGDPSVYSQVPFRDHDFYVSFSALSFVSERNVRFRYRLEGMDEAWIETASREARYSNLPAGDYTFEVVARHDNGPWSPAIARVPFRIIPPWWQTWWFRTAAGGALAGLVYAILRARVKKMLRERRRLEIAVGERTSELQLQKRLVEQQKQEIEELLRKSQEISRLKSEFLANMSHEIRTPMNGVLGMTQLVLDTPLNEEQREYIATVRDSAESLLVVINDILDFSKIEAGKMELARDPFSVRKCVGDALQVFSWKAEAKGLRLDSEIDPRVPELVAGDAGRVRQILLNLLGNAMKFTERGEIRLMVVPDEQASSPSHLRFSVADTGIGIPPDKQAVIFEAFAQADGSSRRRCGGTGLGLAISSKIAKLMGGRLWVVSDPGAGSTFTFTVPLAPSDGFEIVAAPSGPRVWNATPPGAMPACLSILLAEDNAVNQRLAQRMIEKMGHQVTVVDNGRKAVETALRQNFDIILMDLQMPEMDGFEATACIRDAEARARRYTPIVAVTAHAMAGDREQCLRAGMDHYISKPIDFQALRDLVNRCAG